MQLMQHVVVQQHVIIRNFNIYQLAQLLMDYLHQHLQRLQQQSLGQHQQQLQVTVMNITYLQIILHQLPQLWYLEA